MKRAIFQDLKQWAESPHLMPLLLRGARQVGKTFIVEKFAQTHFKEFVNINFELEPEYSQCFETLKPNEIINAIQALKRQLIVPGQTLLFLDEIQNCPRAIMALRYFKEKIPNLHIIGAGSLLEFVLNYENFTMPVGRVQYIYLKPLSFQEFLQASGYEHLLENIRSCTFEKPLATALHQQALKLLREYLIIGGMPAAVQTYLDTHDYLQTQRIQTAILATYRNDFGKYAKLAHHKYLQVIFNKTPGLIGQQIKYSKVIPDLRSRDLKPIIESLIQAGIIQPVISASGLPLSALTNEKKFKLLFLDIGLVNRSVGIAVNELLREDIILINQGAIAEQLVGQELLAYQDCYEEPTLFFWEREEKSSSAEVDYVITLDSKIIPIEVKAGSTGRLKSLQIMMTDKQLSLGVRISQQPLQLEKNILSIPMYMICELQRLTMLANEILTNKMAGS